MNVKFRMFSLLVLSALFVTACAPQSAAAPAQPTAIVQAPQPAATQAAAASTEEMETAGTKLELGKDDKLGTFLVDEQGMTLYLYTKDTPNTSVCYDACAEKWPPLLTTGAPAAGTGVDAALMGTTERKDGAMQVTYKGWPLYYWWKDLKVGDTLGQDVGGVWYVLSPSGEMITIVSDEPVAAATEAAAAPAVVAAPSTSGETEVEMEDHDALGPILVDSNGMTLYLYTKDTPNTSVCYDACATNWPPLLVSGELKARDGVDAARLGTTQRTDGALQVTYNGWPLYYYIKDTQEGDTQGQGVGSVWYVISPAGEMITTIPY